MQFDPGKSPLKKWIRDHLDYPHKDWCLIWPFGSKRAGYGSFVHNGKMLSVHRFICEQIHGPCPIGLVAAHSCGRGHEGCVNPNHVSWKTNSENQLERTDRGKRSKLTKEQAAQIRAVAGWEPVEYTAKLFGISESAVRQVQSGKTWCEDKRTRAGDLSPAQVESIRRMKGKYTLKQLAEEFEVSLSVIWRIHHGKTYKHVPLSTGMREP